MKASPLRPISIGISPADLQLQSITAFRRYDMLYGNDDKTFRFTRRNPDGTVPVACAVVTLPGGVQIVNPTSSPNCLVGGINNTPPQVFAQDRVDFRRALSYLPTDDITLYASIASGCKADGANSRPERRPIVSRHAASLAAVRQKIHSSLCPILPSQIYREVTNAIRHGREDGEQIRAPATRPRWRDTSAGSGEGLLRIRAAAHSPVRSGPCARLWHSAGHGRRGR